MSDSESFTGTTLIGVVLDKSGSMGAVRRETIDGFNAWLEEMQKGSGTTLLTLTLFADSATTPIRLTPIAKVNRLDESRYQPSGNTALLDAVAATIRDLEQGTDVGAEQRFLVCIVTDGQENHSTATTKEQLAALIREKEATGRWTFTYLSAGMDAFSDAQSIGIAAANTQAYTGDRVGTQAAFRNAGAATRGFVASASLKSADFYGGRRHAGGAGIGPSPAAPNPAPPATVGASPWTTAEPAAASSGWVLPD